MHRPAIVALAALLTFLFVTAHTAKPAVGSSYSDRQIFEGVVFGVGPVAELVPEAREQLRPEIYAQNADELASMTAVRTSLLASIERAQPGFIGEFARVARGGDPAAIRSMLERATNAVNDAAAEMKADGLDGAMFANMPAPDGPYRPTPRPKPGIEQQPQLFANMPAPDGPYRPTPRPKPIIEQEQPQLFANMPAPDGPYRPTPRPKPVITSPQLAAQPAWALFTSHLFTEQLAASMAVKLERSAPAEG